MELVTELMGVDGGRAVDYAQIEREMAERTAAVERAPHQSLLAELDVDAHFVTGVHLLRPTLSCYITGAASSLVVKNA